MSNFEKDKIVECKKGIRIYIFIVRLWFLQYFQYRGILNLAIFQVSQHIKNHIRHVHTAPRVLP